MPAHAAGIKLCCSHRAGKTHAEYAIFERSIPLPPTLQNERSNDGPSGIAEVTKLHSKSKLSVYLS